MYFRVSAVLFKNIPLNSIVATWTKDGPNKNCADTYTFVGIGKPTEHSLKKGDRGTLKFEMEDEGGSGGNYLLNDVEFFERDAKGVLNFYLTEQSSPTVCM